MHASLAEPLDFGKIGCPTVNRRGIELEVARVDDQTRRSVDCEPDGIWDAMADAKRLDREITGLVCRVAVRVELDHLDLRAHLAIVELGADQTQRQPGRVYGHRRQVRDEIGQGADM